MPWYTEGANRFLLHVFNNAAWPDVGNVAGLQPAGAAGYLYVGLHTLDPAAGGTQATNEATYTGYVRKEVARASGAGGWTVTAHEVVNASLVVFGAATGAITNTLQYTSFGTDASGPGHPIGRQPLNANLIVSAGITPQFQPGALKWTAPIA
jgi:hypothetical protein